MGRSLFKPHRFSRSSPDSGEHPLSDLPLILASGLGRSGTTVLRNSLCAHPQIAGGNFESNYIYDLMRSADKNLEHKDRVKNMPTSEADYWLRHRQLMLHLFWPADQLSETTNKLAISTYSMLGPRAAIALDKSFSRLAICYIIRNGIEVVSSYLAFEPFKKMTFEEICRLWALRNDMVNYARRQRHIFLFRFEWFQTPSKYKEELTKALAFIGLDYDVQCSAPLETIYHPTVFSGESRKDASDVSQRKERWKLWSAEQRQTFVALCGDAMKFQGYEIPWV